MSKALITNSTLTDIADAIRAKGGTSAAMLPSAMPAAIEAIPTGGGEHGKWIRGADWPDMDSLTLTNDDVYLSVFSTGPEYLRYVSFCATVDNGGWTARFGHIVNGTFVADTTQEAWTGSGNGTVVKHAIPTASETYVVHIRPTNSGSHFTVVGLLTISQWSNVYGRYADYNQPIREFYCKCDNLTRTSQIACGNLERIVYSGTVQGDVGYLCTGCTVCSVDLSNLNFTLVQNLFFACCSLYDLTLPSNISCSTSAQNIFYNCYSLKSLNLENVDFRGTTNFYGMFNNSQLGNIKFDSTKMPDGVLNLGGMFWGANVNTADLTGLVARRGSTGLDSAFFTNIYQLKDIGAPVLYGSFKVINGWKHDSIMKLINALPQLEEGETFTFTMGSAGLAELSAEEKQIATDKGWTLA